MPSNKLLLFNSKTRLKNRSGYDNRLFHFMSITALSGVYPQVPSEEPPSKSRLTPDSGRTQSRLLVGGVSAKRRADPLSDYFKCWFFAFHLPQPQPPDVQPRATNHDRHWDEVAPG